MRGLRETVIKWPHVGVVASDGGDQLIYRRNT
jgi:hypothetical protein